MTRYRPEYHGLPSKEQILAFIGDAETTVGKREIAKHFKLTAQDKIGLKAILKDMAEEGLIDGKRSAFHRMGGVPKVTVLRIVEIDEGEPVAIPESWQADDGIPPPRLRVIEKKKQPALRVGDRILARTEEAGTGFLAHPMKKLPSEEGAMLGVIERDGAGKAWLAPVDKRIRNSSPVSDLGNAVEGQLVLAEPTGRGLRAGVKVIEVLGDPLAPRSYQVCSTSSMNRKFWLRNQSPPPPADQALCADFAGSAKPPG